MSGHSKWSTIKHKKAMMDSRRGQLFTKLGRAITIAAREGGRDETSNFKLRLTVTKARQFNMPKKNIDRAIDRGVGQGGGGSLVEGVYEGYGPGKIAVMVEVVTDNKNRTAAEIKKFFEKGGGSLGQPGSVGYLFTQKSRIVVEKTSEVETEMLQLIDLGSEDVEEMDEGIEVLIEAGQLGAMRDKVEVAGLKVKQAELVFNPNNLLKLDEKSKTKAVSFLENLSDLDDVQNVYTDLDI